MGKYVAKDISSLGIKGYTQPATQWTKYSSGVLREYKFHINLMIKSYIVIKNLVCHILGIYFGPSTENYKM